MGWEAGLIGVYDHRDNMLSTGGYIPCFHPFIILMCVAPLHSKVFITGEFPLHFVFFFPVGDNMIICPPDLEEMILFWHFFIFGAFLPSCHRCLLLIKILVSFTVPGVLLSWQKPSYCRCISRSRETRKLLEEPLIQCI